MAFLECLLLLTVIWGAVRARRDAVMCVALPISLGTQQLAWLVLCGWPENLGTQHTKQRLCWRGGVPRMRLCAHSHKACPATLLVLLPSNLLRTHVPPRLPPLATQKKQPTRLLAVVIAKNAVGSSWRKTLGSRCDLWAGQAGFSAWVYA